MLSQIHFVNQPQYNSQYQDLKANYKGNLLEIFAQNPQFVFTSEADFIKQGQDNNPKFKCTLKIKSKNA